MSATNRTVEAEVLTLDVEESKKAREKFDAEVARIVAETGQPEALIRDVLGAARKGRKKTKRARGDFYETPPWCVDAIVPFLPISGEPVIVDAGSGTGAISARLAAINPKAEILGIEKQPELVELARARGLVNAEFREGNFLNDALDTIKAPDLVIMNPPFGFALQFIQRANHLVKRGGTVCALLRMNWLAGKCRRDFLKKHLPNLHVLTKRPSFTGKGTDATEYAWFIWGQSITLAHDPIEAARLARLRDLPLEDVIAEAYAAGVAHGSALPTGQLRLLTHDDKSKRRPRAPRTTPQA